MFLFELKKKIKLQRFTQKMPITISPWANWAVLFNVWTKEPNSLNTMVRLMQTLQAFLELLLAF